MMGPSRTWVGAIVAWLMLTACSRSAGTVVLAWGSDEPTGTTYEVAVDDRVVSRVTTRGREKAEIEDAEGKRRRTHAPLEIDLPEGQHELRITKNGKPHWSKVITVTDGRTEFYYSLPDPDGESGSEEHTRTTANA
jgi:hypothetical protein